jgi:hypothetical protein
VQAARAQRHLGPGAQRQVTALGLRTRDFHARLAGHARAQQLCRARLVEQAHAQALERAGEHDFLDRAARDVIGAQLLARRGELDFLGTQHRDHFMFASGLHLLGAFRVHGRGTEADAIGTLARQQQVRGTEEGGDETRGGLGVEIVGIADFQQPAVVHHADGVGQREGLFLVVCHQHGGDAELALHGADGTAQFLADLRVERAEGFVEQQHLGLVRQGARHGDALLLAARELAGQSFVEALERHELEQFLAAGDAIRALHAPYAQCEFDVVGHGHVAEQRVVLEHQADAAVAGPHVGHVAAMQGNASVIDAGESGDGAQQGALAAAGRAQEYEEFPLTHLDRHVVDDRLFLIPLGDLV